MVEFLEFMLSCDAVVACGGFFTIGQTVVAVALEFEVIILGSLIGVVLVCGECGFSNVSCLPEDFMTSFGLLKGVNPFIWDFWEYLGESKVFDGQSPGDLVGLVVEVSDLL